MATSKLKKNFFIGVCLSLIIFGIGLSDATIAQSIVAEKEALLPPPETIEKIYYDVIEKPTTNLVAAQKFGELTEDIGARTANTETYLRPDGSKLYKVWSINQYQLDEASGLYQYQKDYELKVKAIDPVGEVILRKQSLQDIVYNWFAVPYAWAQTQIFGYGGVQWGSVLGSYSSARNASSANYDFSNNQDNFYTQNDFVNPNYTVYRGRVDFNTDTAIADGYQVSSSTLMIKCQKGADADNMGVNVVSYTGAQISAEDDFNDLGSTIFAPTYDTTSMNGVSPDWISFLFNSSGRAYISTTSTTSIGFRSSGDVNNTQPAGRNYVYCLTALQSGTSSDPYMLIETEEIPAGTTTASSTVGNCDMTAGAIDDDAIATFLLYWFYVVLLMIILTLGYWLIDKFLRLFAGK